MKRKNDQKILPLIKRVTCTHWHIEELHTHLIISMLNCMIEVMESLNVQELALDCGGDDCEFVNIVLVKDIDEGSNIDILYLRDTVNKTNINIGDDYVIIKSVFSHFTGMLKAWNGMEFDNDLIRPKIY